MSLFRERMAQAEKHESTVRGMLEERGWLTIPFGQSQLTEQARDQLKRFDTPLRWIPDILTVKNTELILIDAKTTRRVDTGNVDIEKASFDAHIALTGIWRVKIFYVWFDYSVCDVWTVNDHGRIGQWRGNGSGTPFILVPRSVMRPFDEVFGR